jgi:hypothetical protein
MFCEKAKGENKLTLTVKKSATIFIKESVKKRRAIVLQSKAHVNAYKNQNAPRGRGIRDGALVWIAQTSLGIWPTKLAANYQSFY